MIDNYQTHTTASGDGLTSEEEIKGLGLDSNVKENVLDSPAVRNRFRKVLSWWKHARVLQSASRLERMEAHEYYDGEQWTQEDKDEIEERGQDPMIFNLCKPTVDWIVGTEKRTRVDHRVLPRTQDDAKGAEVKTKLLKYIADVNKSVFERSTAFHDTTISGLGWIETGIEEDSENNEPLFYRYEDWRNVWYDPLSVRRDLSDARFLFRTRYTDYDIACMTFPDRAGVVRASMINSGNQYYDEDDLIEEDRIDLEAEIMGAEGGEYGHAYNLRNRVKLVECWYRNPEKVKIIRGEGLGTLNGAIFEPEVPSMVELINLGYAELQDAIRLRIWHMVFTGNYVLQHEISPYAHNRFPLTPIWGYRRKKDNSPYGIVENIKDPQYDLNKRRIKSLYLLSTNKIIADDDVTEDWDELYDEAQRPDGILKKKPGRDLDLVNNVQMGEEHVMLANEDRRIIESAGGVTDENRGVETNAQSGKAIRARQEQGHVTTAELFDNLRYAIQLLGEIELLLTEQYYTEEKTIRIVSDKGRIDWAEINAPDESGYVGSDISEAQADFVVDSVNFSASIRQAMFDSLGEILTRLAPEVALQLLDLWIDLSDLPGKDIMVERLRKLNGQPDPNEDESDPEVQAEKQAQMEAEQQQAELEQMIMNLEIEAKQVANEHTRAQIEEVIAKARGIYAKIENDRKQTTIKRAEVVHKIEESEKPDPTQKKIELKKKSDKPKPVAP